MRKIFTALDLFTLQWASEPRISPDGAAVAYLRVRPDIQTDTLRRELHCLDVMTGNARTLVEEAADPSSPRWSPDGTRVAILSRHDDRGQVEIVHVEGGGRVRLLLGDVRPLNIAWSPLGESIAFAGETDEEEYPWSLPTAPGGARWAPRPIVVDRLQYRTDDRGYYPRRRVNIYRVVLATGVVSQLTTGSFRDCRDGVLDWTPDGTRIIFSGNRELDGEDRPYHTRIYAVAVADGRTARITSSGGLDSGGQVSPDGMSVAFLRHDDPLQPYRRPRLYRCSIEGGEPHEVAPDFDCPIRQISWAADGTGILGLVDRKGRTAIVRVGLDGSVSTVVEEIGGGWISRAYLGGAYSQARNGALAFPSCHQDRLPEVAVLTIPGASKIVTAFGSRFVQERDLGTIREISARATANDAPIQGWMLLPPGFEEGRRYPLILDIHGGPWADFGPQFSVIGHLYAAAGYIVLTANPRGSTGYGEAFATAVNGAFPGADYDDLMAITDAAISTGIVDSANAFVTGSSGGGTLTAWIVGKTHRFRAASSVKPIIDYMSWTLTVDGQEDHWLLGWLPKYPPWTAPEELWKVSPLSLADRIETPTMLICGEADYRTPIWESEQLYTALRRRKQPCALVRIPEANHNASRPSQWLAHAMYTIDWFNRYRRETTE